MKVLNLYACLGGNRLLWDDCEVTAVELDPELARMYKERFTEDTVVVADAHQYLLENYRNFDFIWSSPPCPTHSRARFWGAKGMPDKVLPKYPDFKLYEEITFLSNWFEGKWVVENVVPYYEPLMNPTKIGRHLFWSNFIIPQDNKKQPFKKDDILWLKDYHKIEKFDYQGGQPKNKILRNLVHFDTGKYIFDLAKGIYKSNNSNQTKLEI